MKKTFVLLLFLYLCSAVFSQQKYHDAAMFNAPFSDVKSIQYKGGVVCFNQDGSLDKKNSNYLEHYSKYEIVRDKNGYPTMLTTDFDKTKFEYDVQHRVIKKTVTGGGNIVITYKYEKPNVIVSRIVVEAGQPQKTETVYDMNEYDSRGNWTQKGLAGHLVKKQDVSQTHIGTFISGYDKTNVIEYEEIEGRTSENRIIRYWTGLTFKRSDSPNEISILEAMEDPFFLNINSYSIKLLESNLKKINHTVTKGYYGKRYISVDETNKVFYKYPVKAWCQYWKSGGFKNITQYKLTIVINDTSEREDFFNFIIDEYKNSEYFVNFENNELKLKKKNLAITVKKTDEGVIFIKD